MGRPRKPREKKPKVEWRAMPEVQPLIEELVRKHHKHLERAEIRVVGKPKAGARQGKRVVATVRRASSEMNALFSDEAGETHYIIQLGLDLWGALDQKEKRRELDRALCYFTGLDEKERWAITGPDVEEFTAILQRHGPYNADLETFVAAARQLDLPGTI